MCIEFQTWALECDECKEPRYFTRLSTIEQICGITTVLDVGPPDEYKCIVLGRDPWEAHGFVYTAV